jgi:hypothetical protein
MCLKLLEPLIFDIFVFQFLWYSNKLCAAGNSWFRNVHIWRHALLQQQTFFQFHVNSGYLQLITDVQKLVLHKIELLLENDVDVFIYKSQLNAKYHIRKTHGDKTNKYVYISATLVDILREAY